MAELLEYAAPENAAGLVIDDRPDGGVTITVPTRRRNFRYVYTTVARADLFGFLAGPLIALLYKLIATTRPRAVLRLTADEFILTETSDESPGYVTRAVSWPRSAVSELRPNRYTSGLYLRIAGKENIDLLTDLPAGTIRAIGDALATAGASLDRRAADDRNPCIG